MESMIRKIVQEEVRKCASPQSSTTVESSSSSSTSTKPPSRSKTQNRLSSLLTKIRKGKQEKFKDIKIQVNEF